MDSQAPDSQCSKLSSHHHPLMAYRPMVSSATRTHRLEENFLLTPHLSFPRPEARTFSPSSHFSRHSRDFHAEFPFHLLARKSHPPTPGTPWFHATTEQAHHNHLVP